MKKLFTFCILILLSTSLFAQDVVNVNGAKSKTNDTSKPIQLTQKGTSIWLDDMNGNNSMAGLVARGYVVLNEDGGGTSDPFFQGSVATFPAYEGPDTGFVATNYNGGNGGLIDQWLISPEITVTAGDTLSFFHKSPDASQWPDSIAVLYAPNAGTTVADFTEQWEYFQTSTAGWQKWSNTFPNSGTFRFAIRYYITDNVTNSNFIGLDYFEITTPGGASSAITIAEAREDLDNNYSPDRLGDTVTVRGIVTSVSFNTGNFNHNLQDATGGITTIGFGLNIPEFAVGTELEVTGEIGQYRGLVQLEPLDSASVSVVSTGNVVPDYQILTIAQFLANPEQYESSLIAFQSLSKVDGETWPAAGSNGNYALTDLTDTITFRIDKETDLDDNPEPVWPKDIIGTGGQFTFDDPADNGYQLTGLSYADILPVGTVPVELTSFTASVTGEAIILNWATATETNNSGFAIERSEDAQSYQEIGFVNGKGNTTSNTIYTYSDDVAAGKYFYRLKQVDFDGSYTYSNTVEANMSLPEVYALEQNYPNPFNPSTNISFKMPAASMVNITVFNVLGEKVASVVNQFMEAGSHTVKFNANNLNSGVYFYRLESNNIVLTKKMMLLK